LFWQAQRGRCRLIIGCINPISPQTFTGFVRADACPIDLVTYRNCKCFPANVPRRGFVPRGFLETKRLLRAKRKGRRRGLRGDVSSLKEDADRLADCRIASEEPMAAAPDEHEDVHHPGEEKVRKCLICKTPFQSAWAGERVCRRCKSTSTWRSTGLD